MRKTMCLRLACAVCVVGIGWGCGGSDSTQGSAGGGTGGVGGSTTAPGGGGQGGDTTSTGPGGGGQGGDTTSTSTGGGGGFWDPTIANDPPTKEFLFVGAPADELYPSECIYRFTPGSAPEVLFCPELSFDAERAIFVATEAPREGMSSFIVVVEQDVIDIYPLQIYRVSVADGQAELLDEFDGAPMIGEQRIFRGVLSLDEQSFAALVWRFPDVGPSTTEVYRSTGVMDFDAGVEIPGEFQSIRGRMGGGTIAVSSLNTDGGAYLVDTGTAPPTITDQLPIYAGREVAPDGSVVSFIQAPFGGPEHVGVFGPSGQKSHEVQESSLVAGFVDAGSLLVASTSKYHVWTPADDGWTDVPGNPGYRPRGSFRRVAGGIGFVAWKSAGGSFQRGVGWYGDGQLPPMCGAMERVRTIQDLPGEPAPVVLLDDAGDDLVAPRLGAIHSCRPGGQPVDLLAEHGIAGRLLTPASDFFE